MVKELLLVTAAVFVLYLGLFTGPKSSKVTDEEVYLLMNDLLHGNDTIRDEQEFTTIELSLLPLPGEEELIAPDFIPDSVLTKEDKAQLLENMLPGSFTWDIKRLKYTKGLDNSEIRSIFSNHQEDGWKLFRKKYGKHGLHRFSLPVFNNRRDIAVMNMEGRATGQ